jgi:tetratricopeptide (TPR) repeat protein
MDGKVLLEAFVKPPNVASIPSWEEVQGADGCHPPCTRLDPVAAHEALQQMIALGYVEPPGENSEVVVSRTIRELRYNLAQAYQDGDRHLEAREIFAELCAADADEQRFAVRLFVSCQALGLDEEMRRIVDDLDGRRRPLFEEAKAKVEAFEELAAERAEVGREPDSLLSEDERRELARWRSLAQYQPAVTDYLKAQVLIAEKRYPEALAAFERVAEAGMVRPSLFFETADLYLRLRRWGEAQMVYEKALAIDPDNAHAHLGMCCVALRRRKFTVAAQSALEAVQRNYHYPLAHFLLGVALAGMKEYERAANAFRAAISQNPNFPEAHFRLTRLLEQNLGDVVSAREHRRLAHGMKSRRTNPPLRLPESEKLAAVGSVSTSPDTATVAVMPPLAESVVVVTGLPRSGTSMLMQMLAAGGLEILSDELRQADEDNPRGYFEFEPVKSLPQDSKWLLEAQGKAVKIVIPLLAAVPRDLACRVILCERDLDEVLESQERMLARRNQAPAMTPHRRRMLKEEYMRTLSRAEAMLARRPRTRLLPIKYLRAISDSRDTAEKVNRFLGGGLDVAKMAAVIDAALYRNRAATVNETRTQ